MSAASASLEARRAAWCAWWRSALLAVVDDAAPSEGPAPGAAEAEEPRPSPTPACPTDAAEVA